MVNNSKKKYVSSNWEVVYDSNQEKEHNNYLYLTISEIENNRRTEIFYCGIYMKNLKYVKNRSAILFVTLLGLFEWNANREGVSIEGSWDKVCSKEKKKC